MHKPPATTDNYWKQRLKAAFSDITQSTQTDRQTDRTNEITVWYTRV